MGTGRAYGRREQAAGASALVLFVGALYILGVFTPTPPLPGEPRSTCDVARPPDVPSHLAARPDPKKPDPATQQLSRWRCTLW